MRTIFFTLASVLLLTAALGQKATKKPKSWKSEVEFSVLGAQTGSRNWAPANEKFSVTGIGMMSIALNQLKGKIRWDNSADVSYGTANTSSGGPRKVEDKLDFFSRYGYYFRKSVGAGLTAGLRTQFSNSFDYSLEPKKRISGFFAPAYLVLSPSLHYRPHQEQELVFTAGPAARWIFVSNSPYSFNYQGGIKPSGDREKSIAEIYGVHPERESRFEAGIFLTATYNRKEIIENIDYKTRLEVMTDILGNDATSLSGEVLVNRNPGTVDIYWSNSLFMRVNNWIQVTYGLDIVYDDDVKIFGTNKNRPATQMRSLLGLGVVARLNK